ncbi:hypothetical protein CY35_09G087300 [Sphagnum magellanicum]|nr:hypothetical protein CY35_09G087300 [Sphagnum magellanicum]
MSNRAVEQQNFDAKDPFAGLALVTKPVPKAEPGHVVVPITLRPVNPTDLLSILYGILTDLKVPKGEYVLQTAAGSVLGRQLIQLAKHWGIKTINIVRRAEQKEELKALGADEVLSTDEEEDVTTRVKEITGGKLAYAALDAVAGTLTKQVAASVRDGGQVNIYGVLGGYDAIVGFGEYIDEVSKLMEAKIIVPLAGKTYDLADFQLAIKKSTEVARGGKVILTG